MSRSFGITPARRIPATLAGLFVADGDGFVTRPVDEAELDLEGFVLPGIAIERHRGHARAADARTPWYRRGEPIRNSRQVSIVSTAELATIARGLDVPAVRPEWLGANMVIDGVENLSMLARGSRLFFAGGAVLAVEELNTPCRNPGRAIAKQYPDRAGLDLAFVKAAARLRGLVAWVERAGTVRAGDAVEVRVPEQWVY
ncbi:MOSC domain-containing protein [Alsobacter sp. SYSU M60028]|uniref:MOSC domain-containing protein n=1 Tax=Alsobacter ponti TaxID=2962936 RepID=A0ABT1LFL6_9HYPH|nr:MOSC domain-containing protein [Alsobacter ponti]MCP8940234.1 MOSC domain-containing protein [Alsobacter ponti]